MLTAFFFFLLHALYYWMRSPSLLILMCIWVNIKPWCSCGCQLPPKPASAMALNHQRTDHDHKEGEPSIWGLMLSSQKLKQESTDTPELTNVHCTQTVPSIRTANWLQVLSPSSPFLQKWWGIFISKSAVPIFYNIQVCEWTVRGWFGAWELPSET